MEYTETTRSIRIQVEPTYLPDQSSVADNRHVWAYFVRIENQGRETVTLINRYWHITDAFGRVQEVRGAGVVGEQPCLGPGDAFEDTSGCPLAAPSGVMVGHYEMETDDGDRFDAKVPAFSLDSPYQMSRPN